jgi:DNA polymerase
MRELETQVRVCRLCKLARTRTNAVPGEGNLHAEVMFIGEGPGYHEDRQGRPFVGAAGQFLNELLNIAGLSREGVYITNVVKCRPPNNRDPEPEEMAACAPYLVRQIELINPMVIVTLGRYSMVRFFPGEKISQIHGTARLVDGRLCVAMYHPAAGLHQASLADVIRSDFKKVPIFVEQARRRLAQAALPDETAEETIAEAALQPIQEAARQAQAATPENNGHGATADEVLAAQEQPAANVLKESSPPQEPVAATTAGAAETKKPAAKRKKSEEKKDDYEQLTFF